ncbi:MAG: hypothetical protein IMW86_04070 [Hydrogenibacillus sp.]|nr:hypothetical protein [Hydrogenibacillus sp.]
MACDPELLSLTRRADSIVLATVGKVQAREPTGQMIGRRRLYRYRQVLTSRRRISGRMDGARVLVTEGLEPSPPVDDPQSARYPGPYAEGEYILFLRYDAAHRGYRLVGEWHGVYPVIGGRLIALVGYGVQALSGLTVDEATAAIRACAAGSRTPGDTGG